MEALIALFALGVAGVLHRDADRGAGRAHAREPGAARARADAEPDGSPGAARGCGASHGVGCRAGAVPKASRTGHGTAAAAAPEADGDRRGPEAGERNRAAGRRAAPAGGGADFATSLGPKILVGAGGLAVVVFLGFFVRYAWENNWVGPTGRVLSAAVFSLGLLALGLRIIGRDYRPLGQGLAATGFAGLYITAFAAHAVYGLVPRSVAAAFMIAVTACAVLAGRAPRRAPARGPRLGRRLPGAGAPLDRRRPGGEPLRLPAPPRRGGALAGPAQALARDDADRPRRHPAAVRRLVRGPLPAGAVRGGGGRARGAHRALRGGHGAQGAAGRGMRRRCSWPCSACRSCRSAPTGRRCCSSCRSASPSRRCGRPAPSARSSRWWRWRPWPCPASPGRPRTTGWRASASRRPGWSAARCCWLSGDPPRLFPRA